MSFDFSTVSAGATAWMLIASALVLFMTPGLAFFYGGMVRAKHVLAMLMQNFMCMALVSVTWVTVGYTLAFGKGNGFWGDFHFAFLSHMNQVVPGFTGTAAMVIAPMVFVIFQMMFAIITPALFLGSTADRWKFSSFVPFIVLWSILVYSPSAHWIFSPVGWLAKRGAEDFAGGIVIHASAGTAALVLAVMLGKRKNWREAARPHNLPMMLIGAGVLWFGWFGFNAGSALDANSVAIQAFVNTNTAAAIGMLAWLSVERLRHGKASTLGAAAGAVAGLAAVTPAAGYVNVLGALAIGLVSGIVCCFAVELKGKLGYDDSLDVVGVHLAGGVVGALLLGLFGNKAINPAGADGLFYGGGLSLLGNQALALIAVMAWAAIVTVALMLVLKKITGNRVSEEDEELGLDQALHGESAYEFGDPDQELAALLAGQEPDKSADTAKMVAATAKIVADTAKMVAEAAKASETAKH
ncbi:ammonium transporter [Nocardia sp. NPDC088792]|uniref:ammonium transporter n=1 Tax=Nocardia sp. NPDC088792 TaxID=3364332 RepID=UPI0037F135A0